MTIKNFAKQYNLTDEEMLEVFVCMGVYSDKKDNWIDKYYKLKIVSDIDCIEKPNYLIKETNKYKELLINLKFSRNTLNSSAKQIIQKNKLNTNLTLQKFISK